jgi:hypothetical protein
MLRMSLDWRLRIALEKLALRHQVDTGRHLQRVLERARRRRRVMLATSVALVAVVLSLAALLIPGALDLYSSNEPISPVHISPGPPERAQTDGFHITRATSRRLYRSVAGDYFFRLTRQDTQRIVLRGSWEIQLLKGGGVYIAPPGPEVQRGYGNLIGVSYRGNGNVLELVRMFYGHCSAEGFYRWHLSGRSLRLEPLSDPCPYRRDVLASVTWKSR